VLGRLLDFHSDNYSPVLDASAQDLARGLLSSVSARAGGAALVLVLEDCHWIDPLRVISSLRSRALAGLTCCCCSPTVRSSVDGDSDREPAHFAEVRLAEFTPGGAQLIRAKLGQMVERTHRHPVPRRTGQRASAGQSFYIGGLLNSSGQPGCRPAEWVGR